MATYYFELIEEGGTVYVIRMNELSIESFNMDDFVLPAHTHTKSDIIDLETITYTPTADAVPKAGSDGKINIEWLDLTGYNTDLNQYRTNWLFHPEGLKNIEFDVEVLDIIKLPIPQEYPGDQVYGEFIHVDLVYNPNGILAPDGNKYPFWIAYSPYPRMQAYYENPCVAYSKDGITWSSNFTLPLIPQSENGYNSDPELFELDDGRLCLINVQYSLNGGHNLQFMIYTPGSGWSNPVTLVSPAILASINPSISQNVLKSLSVVKDTKCREREFVLFTVVEEIKFGGFPGRFSEGLPAASYVSLRRQTLTFSEDYSDATIGDATVCNVIDVDTGNPIVSNHINIRFLDNQYAGIILDRNYNLYWVVSLDGYNFYAKKIIFSDEIIGLGYPYRADFVVQENGVILLYLPFGLFAYLCNMEIPFLFLIRASQRFKTDTQSILYPSSIADIEVDSGNGYQENSIVHYYLSFVDKSGKESSKFYIGCATSSSSFNVNISISSDTTPAYKYKLYRSYNSDSILNITDVYPTLLSAGDSVIDDNSNWTPVSNTTIVGTGGKVLGYDYADGYFFTNKGIKVGETTRPPFVIESTSLVENLNADLLDGKHASDFASSVHTHTKANIIDLETITITPTANAIPKADENGKLNLGWLDLSNYALLNGNNTFTGTNTFGSSVAFPITLVSSDLTLADTHYTVLVDASSGSITITLPDANNVPNGRVYIIKKVDSFTNAVIVRAQSGQTIDNSTNPYSLSNPFATIVVQVHGGNWYIVGYYGG